MSTRIDARGLSCPQPVILTMSRIREMTKGRIEILVDTDTSKENVSRAAKSKGWDVQIVEPDGSGYRIVIQKD
ncbi:MAG TPA: sulfurtransferase TusA family protein [Deltaproteobacteria bacterium]|jgi:TusA-related sulfurtransferase|nr:sulfurtransferase TusA family protein [Deltaproteobacteria bacterium]MDI9544089.1 sulfurtransferase TusA family protein [Pseudomonadota bacterium]HPA84622.1 sulfurtransferase TusA family protein [Deltaproteobacteria bacterium]